MGCGCKNNSSQPQAPVTAAQASQIQQQALQAKQQQAESVKQAIKKTVEKYYSVNKTSK